MNAIKCSNCGLVGFADGGCCKRCGQPVTVQNFHKSGSNLADRVATRVAARFGKLFKFFAVLVIFGVIIVGIAVVREELKKFFDPTPVYLASIDKSGKFKEPVTVRVNQRPIPLWTLTTGTMSSNSTVLVAKNAYVLEALGLLTVSKTTTFHTADLDIINATLETKSEHVDILLTEKGQAESVGWRTTEEPYPGASGKVSWWHVPIGSREIIRIESVIEIAPNIMDVVVRWRWRPNKIGEGFDCGGPIVGSLPTKAQDVVRSLGWNSQIEYSSRGRLQKVGGVWQVLYISFAEQSDE